MDEYKFDSLDPELRTGINAWLARGGTGLWIFGERRSGSSYAARCAVKRHREEFPETKMAGSSQYITAATLQRDIRRMWDGEALLRANANDYSLWVEVSQLQVGFDGMWSTGAPLLLDDLHSHVDLGFFRKHAMPWLEQRVKEGKPTIVAGSTSPEDFSDLAPVINDLFHVLSAER